MTEKEQTMFQFAGYCFIHRPEMAEEINTLIAGFLHREQLKQEK